MCTAHDIHDAVLKAIVLSDIQKHAALAAENVDKYAAKLLQVSESKWTGERAAYQKEADKANKRIAEIDTLIQKLYEDKVFGIISDERYLAMSANLETEQKTLKARYSELTTFLENYAQKSGNVDSFVTMIQGYTEISELSDELLHTLIERIIVHEKTEVDGEIVQQLDIHYRFIGNVNEQPVLNAPNLR